MDMASRYYIQERVEMLPFVPPACASLLDVGCGAGGFGRTVKKAHPAMIVTGVEVEADAAAEARRTYDRVLVGPYPDVLEDLGETFDCIVFNDVLEHVVDPWGALRAAVPRLSPNGVVVASIPNVRYLPVVYELAVHGNWKYHSSGVLDRTHLRFFTRKTIIELFEGQGFVIERLEGLNPLKRWKTAPLRRIPPFKEMHFIQYGVRARYRGEGA